MTEPPEPPEAPPEAPIEAPEPVVRKHGWLPPLVWLIPIVAVVVGLSLVVQLWMQHGPTITIRFNTAEGLEVGQTKVKFKNVDIGVVRSIGLSEDRKRVLVKVELTKDATSFAVKDAHFWVVRPRIAAGGISGLGTLLSGAYIGVDRGKSTEEADTFDGLEVPPAITADQPGRQFVLHTPDLGSINIGAPVYFRHIEVGQIVAYKVDPDGKGVTLNVFVNAPYDRFVTPNSRFWHASGVNVTADFSGLKVQTQALLQILLGGIAFNSPPGDPTTVEAAPNTVFNLASDETAAMSSPDTESLILAMYFNQSVRGLVPGAPVDFMGVSLGEVKSIGVDYEPQKHTVRMPVLVEIFPVRLGPSFQGSASETILRAQIDGMVRNGLRAQLRSGNLITGKLYVALDFFPKAKPAGVDWSKPTPEMPTVPNTLEELQNQLTEIANKLGKVPFDKIGNNLNRTLVTLNGTLKQADGLFKQLDREVAPEAKAALNEARKSFQAVQQSLSADAPLQQDTRNALQQVQRAAESLRALSDYLTRHPESLIRGKSRDDK
jgi:paraquat-inducible protein B